MRMLLKLLPAPRSLARQLLASHLLVASLGVGVLCIALASTFGLRARVLHLADQAGPAAQASLQVLAGVRHSIASLGNWVSRGAPDSLQEWRSAWRDEIEPAMATLQRHQAVLDQAGTHDSFAQLPVLLEKLKQSQTRVQQIAHTPANEPARARYAGQVQPLVAALDEAMAALLQTEPNSPGNSAALIRLAELQRHMLLARLELQALLGSAGSANTDRFEARLQDVEAALAELPQALLTPPQRPLFARLQNNWAAFVAAAWQVADQRASAQWNQAQHWLTTETAPLATQVSGQAATLAQHSAALMEREAEAATVASAVTVWILVVLIVTMLVVAYGVSWERAATLTHPLATLAEATQQLAAGRLNADIPVAGDAELGELTRAFNAMRASLERAQRELRQANATLERRVRERTAALEQANASLRAEIRVRERIDAALRASEAHLRAISDAVPDLLFLLDANGRYIEAFTGHQHLFNAGAAALKGKLLSAVHPPPVASALLEQVQLALTTGKIQIFEYQLDVSTGRRWFEARIAPVEAAASEPAVVVVARDVTERRLAEDQLRQAQKMEAIGHLTGGVAHDFNNILAIILGNLELLEEQLNQRAQQDLLRRALDAADRGALLTQRLLAFSRQQPLQARPTDLNRLVAGMIDLLRRTLGETIQIQTVLAGDLGQTLVDPGQFENALLNLALNARDAMPQGGRLTLRTANRQLDADYAAANEGVKPGDYVMLSVNDSGIGMTPEVLECAFEPFFTTKEVGKGSGLGLSMVYGLINQSGGHVKIESQVGQGTTVRLYLPRTQTAVAEAREQREPAEPVQQGKAEMILVVEDDASVRQLAVRMLNNLGYSTVEARSAKDALQALERQPQIVLLFTDVVLPGDMNGAQLARTAQRLWPDLKVLYTSGYAEDALAHHGRLDEGVELLAKPYRKADLARRLRAVLGEIPRSDSAL